MNGNSILLDSDVIILASKRAIDVERLLTTYDKLYVSVISYMEVYGFAFEDGEEKRLLDKLFTDIEIVHTDKEIADIAIVYRKNPAKKDKTTGCGHTRDRKVFGNRLSNKQSQRLSRCRSFSNHLRR